LHIAQCSGFIWIGTIKKATHRGFYSRKLAEARGNERYLKLPLSMKPIEAARLLWRLCKELNVSTLNIAGNGIYTLNRHG
jgi:hypothetical protein